MKKKILALALCAVMLAVAAVGGTLAYFTDTDAQTNVFTYGNVKIDLFEDFNSENINIVPAVFKSKDGSAGYGTWLNSVEKEVYVKNTGSEEAYVRVHIAVPKLASYIVNKCSDVDVNKAAKKIVDANRDILNLTREEYTVTNKDGNADANMWNWGKTAESVYKNSDDRNTYEVTINNIPYKVYVVTYEGILRKKNDVTIDAINGVYMHSEVTNEMIQYLDATFADSYGSPNWARIYVVAEAAQADGFGYEIDANDKGQLIANADVNGIAAFEALNTAFGDPALTEAPYKLTEADFLAVPEGETFVERTATNE